MAGRPSQAEQLPRGRHGLTREQVTEQQTGRLIAAMIDAVTEQGYARTGVVDVIGRARISRRTFYELFEDKDACFLAVYDALVANLIAETTAAYEASPEAPWAERIRAGLEAFLRHLAQHPDEARICIVEVLAAGPKVLARRDAAIRQFAYFIDGARSESSAEVPGITAVAVVGGINELLYSEIIHGATAQLPTRLPELVYWVIQPFLGSERAAQERDRARRSPAESHTT